MPRKKIIQGIDYIGKFITGFADIGNLLYFTKSALNIRHWSVLLSPFRFIFFPLALFTKAFSAVSAWLDASVNHYQGSYLVKAIAETLATIATAVAAIGVIAGCAAFAVAGPVIYGVALVAGALVDIGLAIYYGVMSTKTKDQEQKGEFTAKMTDHSMNALLGGVVGGLIIATAVLGVAAVDMMLLLGSACTIVAATFWTILRGPLLNKIREDGIYAQKKELHADGDNKYKNGTNATLSNKLKTDVPAVIASPTASNNEIKSENKQVQTAPDTEHHNQMQAVTLASVGMRMK